MKTSKKLKIGKFEFACYITSGVLGLWGIVEIILGGVAINLGMNEPLRKANETFRSLFGLDMIYWGIILLVIGSVIAVITLLVCAKSLDREFEKSQRRAARLGKDVKAEEPVIDAKVEEAKVEEIPAPVEETK